MKDLDLSSVCNAELGNWTPIGSKEHPFRGNFNGNGKTIDYLYLDGATSNSKLQAYGLFSQVESEEVKAGSSNVIYIKNLTLGEHSSIHNESSAHVGGIIGQAVNNVQIDSGLYVAKAQLLYDPEIYDVVGETSYELTWMISYDTAQAIIPTESSSSQSATSSSDVASSSSGVSENSSSSVEKELIVAHHMSSSVKLTHSGSGSYLLDFANGNAGTAQIQVFDMMGNRISAEIRRSANQVELSGIPRDKAHIIKVRGNSHNRTFKVNGL